MKLENVTPIKPDKTLMQLTNRVLDQNAEILSMNRDLLRVLSCLPICVSTSDNDTPNSVICATHDGGGKDGGRCTT